MRQVKLTLCNKTAPSKTPRLMKTFMLIPAFCLIVFSCRKDDPLPAATQSGANTFGCKVNGKVWIPDGAGGFAQIEAISGGYVGYSVDSTTNNIFISTYN